MLNSQKYCTDHVPYICDWSRSLHPKFNLYFLYNRELMDIVEKRVEQSEELYHVQYICDRLKSLHPKFNLYFLY